MDLVPFAPGRDPAGAIRVRGIAEPEVERSPALDRDELAGGDAHRQDADEHAEQTAEPEHTGAAETGASAEEFGEDQQDREKDAQGMRRDGEPAEKAAEGHGTRRTGAPRVKPCGRRQERQEQGFREEFALHGRERRIADVRRREDVRQEPHPVATVREVPAQDQPERHDGQHGDGGLDQTDREHIAPGQADQSGQEERIQGAVDAGSERAGPRGVRQRLIPVFGDVGPGHMVEDRERAEFHQVHDPQHEPGDQDRRERQILPAEFTPGNSRPR